MFNYQIPDVLCVSHEMFWANKAKTTRAEADKEQYLVTNLTLLSHHPFM